MRRSFLDEYPYSQTISGKSGLLWSARGYNPCSPFALRPMLANMGM